MKIFFLSLVMIPLLSACANSSTQAKAEPQEPKEYQTGSNIPRRDRSGTGAINADKDAVEQAIRTTMPSTPKVGG